MDLNEVADDGQTKSEAAMGTGCRKVGLPEPFEYIRKEFRTDSLPCIHHNDLNVDSSHRDRISTRPPSGVN